MKNYTTLQDKAKNIPAWHYPIYKKSTRSIIKQLHGPVGRKTLPLELLVASLWLKWDISTREKVTCASAHIWKNPYRGDYWYITFHGE